MAGQDRGGGGLSGLKNRQTEILTDKLQEGGGLLLLVYKNIESTSLAPWVTERQADMQPRTHTFAHANRETGSKNDLAV